MDTLSVPTAFVLSTPLSNRRTNAFLVTFTPQRTTHRSTFARNPFRNLHGLSPVAKLSQKRQRSTQSVETNDLPTSAPASLDTLQSPATSIQDPSNESPTSNRLFSNIDSADDGTLVRKKPSEIAAAALISVSWSYGYFCTSADDEKPQENNMNMCRRNLNSSKEIHRGWNLH